MAEGLQTYLESGASNRLLKAVLYDLKNPTYLAGVKVLGLVTFLVTVPLWSSTEDKTIHLLDIGNR